MPSTKPTGQTPRTYAVCVYCKKRSTNRDLFTIDPYFPQAGVTYRCADIAACETRYRERLARKAEKRQQREAEAIATVPADAEDITTNQATKLGAEKGRNAASWVFDGNTPTETYATVLRGLEDGDPAIYDMFRAPDLSGEYADDYSERDLAEDLGIDQAEDFSMTNAANAYNDAAHEAFWSEIERVARQHVTSKSGDDSDRPMTLTDKIDALTRAGFTLSYARIGEWWHPTWESPLTWRPFESRGSTISYSHVSNTPGGYDGSFIRAYVDLGDIARGEDYYSQTTTVDRSNFRSLMRDYPDIFTPTAYSNVDSLGAYIRNLTNELIGILIDLKEQYPLYDESDLSELESDEITESWDQYVSSDIRREMSETTLDAWDELSNDTQRETFWAAVEATDSYPEHDGHDVLWRYDAIVKVITEKLSS